MKRQDIASRTGGALGEHGDGPPLAQKIGHPVCHMLGMARSPALDEQGIGLFAQPADERPAPNLRFGEYNYHEHTRDSAVIRYLSLLRLYLFFAASPARVSDC